MVKIQNAIPGSSAIFTGGGARTDWVGQQLKAAESIVLNSLKKVAFVVSSLFAQLGKYLYQGALVVKGTVYQGISLAKSFLSNHPRELKIAAASAIGLALAALICHLFITSNDRPNAANQTIDQTEDPQHAYSV